MRELGRAHAAQQPWAGLGPVRPPEAVGLHVFPCLARSVHIA